MVPAQNGGGEIIRLDPALDALISPGAKIEKLADGFGFTEGRKKAPTQAPQKPFVHVPTDLFREVYVRRPASRDQGSPITVARL